ncbi:MAG: non-homologous end joining protein Ku [Roseateles sp.]|uniref:non-homologous end joining protein Ku n=1 Tax=Roseateles sp. TaxID=1971397 RepID=UPI0040370650
MAEDAKPANPRAIWKGAISFGLVHVPVSLHTATSEQEIDFDWLDKRSMDPVGYKRINKRTGKEITKENIVKGVKLEGDDYVVLSDDEIKAAYPKRTQTIQIESFVKATEVSFVYIEKPYYLAPDGRAGRVYALLREALEKSGVIGIARFVLHNKEHLAALIPAGPALMLGTLRWAEEIRSPEPLDLPKAGAGDLKPAELKMAQQLIAQMTQAWQPGQFKDDFSSAIRALVSQKAKAGDKATVQPLEEAPDLGGADNVVDLTELLRQSLGGKTRGGGGAAKTGKKPAAKSPVASRKKAA